VSYTKRPASVALAVFRGGGVELSAHESERALVEHLVGEVRLYGPKCDDAELASWLERVSALAARAALALRAEIGQERRAAAPDEEQARAAHQVFRALEGEARILETRGRPLPLLLSDDLRVHLLDPARGNGDVETSAIAVLAELRPSRSGWSVDVVLRAPGGPTLTRRAASPGDVPRAEFAALLSSVLPDGPARAPASALDLVGGSDVFPAGLVRDAAGALLAALDEHVADVLHMVECPPLGGGEGRVAIECSGPDGSHRRSIAWLCWDRDHLAVRPQVAGAHSTPISIVPEDEPPAELGRRLALLLRALPGGGAC
jgi:hypothetical protein